MLQVFFKFPFDVRVGFAASLILPGREGEMRGRSQELRWEEGRRELFQRRDSKLPSRKGMAEGSAGTGEWTKGSAGRYDLYEAKLLSPFCVGIKTYTHV